LAKEPNFSAYPFARLRKLSRRDAQLESTLARWIAARSRGERLGKLVGGAVTNVEVVATVDANAIKPRAFDPFAARCEVRVRGAAIEVRGSSMAVRTIAQRLVGGPAELAAPRPLGVVEKSIFALVVATALEDLGVAGEVWPNLDIVDVDVPARTPGRTIVELAITVGDLVLSVQIHAAPELLLRAPPPRELPAWFDAAKLEVAIVLGRCALAIDDLARLAVRSLITLERPAGNAELHVLGGAIGVAAAPGAVVAEVVTGYVPRDMSLPDQAHVELTVALGTTQLSLRQISELALGQIIQLGRPLAGPFELRAAGRVVGRGELVDVDGELAVRIVSLGD
jgi:flagellar motor switch/type III secretory pathway protein FliN